MAKAKKKMLTRMVSFKLPAHLLETLEEVRWQERRTKQAVLIAALEQYFKQNGSK